MTAEQAYHVRYSGAAIKTSIDRPKAMCTDGRCGGQRVGKRASNATYVTNITEARRVATLFHHRHSGVLGVGRLVALEAATTSAHSMNTAMNRRYRSRSSIALTRLILRVHDTIASKLFDSRMLR